MGADCSVPRGSLFAVRTSRCPLSNLRSGTDCRNEDCEFLFLGRVEVNPRPKLKRWETGQRPERLGDFRQRPAVIEMAGVPLPVCEAARCNLGIAHAVNVDDGP